MPLPSHAARPPAYRGSLLGIALAFTAFVIYGSLVPLDFRPRPWSEAVSMFRNIRYLQLGIGSRADWVSNILLFIPLTFLWSGVWWSRRRWWLNLLSAPLVLVTAIGLSLAIEFTQLFFPPRTVSINDLVAETIGASLGILAWYLAGPRILAWVHSWRGDSGPLSLWTRLLVSYLALLIGYNLLPLDITISPVEIYHKWREGKVILIPFSYAFSAPVEALYALATDVLIWVPVGLLWRLGSRESGANLWWKGMLCAIGVEALQLGIYSRVSDITDIFTAGIGIAGGTLAASFGKREYAPAGAPHSTAGIAWLPFAGALVWGAGLLAIFWYPFEFRTDRAFLLDRIALLRQAPFTAYYYGTEFRAVTEVFHKVGLFVPIGILLALAVGRIARSPWRAFARLGAFAAVCALAGIVETGQLALPEKHADLTDLVLEILGGSAGLFLTARILAAQQRRAQLRRPSRHLRPARR